MASAVTSWAANLVFNPLTWAGVVVGGVAVVMIGGADARCAAGAAPSRSRPRQEAGRGAPSRRRSARRPVDDDMAEIEEILRRRGIG